MAQMVPVQGKILQSTPPQVSYEQRGGVQYQVTRQTVKRQLPATILQNRPQTTYKQQVKSQMESRQHTFCVPVIEYKKISKLHGRWNPFVAPYRTEELKPVTVWKQQVVTLQVPTSHLEWVPETKTVQVPVTTYRTVEEEVITRVAMNGPSGMAGKRPSPARQVTGGPSATLAALPNDPPAARQAAIDTNPMAGVASRTTQPYKGKGWQRIGKGTRLYR